MKIKKLFALFLTTATLTAAITGCGSQSTDTGSSDQSGAAASVQAETDSDDAASAPAADTADAALSDHLTIGISGDVESFNPWLMANDARQQVFYNNIYEPLARLTLEGEREYVIASGMEDKGNGVYEITLHDNVYDSAGNHITADDVIFSYNSCQEQGALSWGIKYLDHFDKIDDYTLEMNLKEESAVAVDMVLKTVFIVSQKAFEESSDGFATSPVGTGPYTLSKYVPGSEVVIEARDDYWQTDESSISIAAKLGSAKTVTYKVITDSAQLALALEMGDIDGSLNIGTADMGNFLNDDRTPKEGYNVTSNLNPLIYYLAFNCDDSNPLSNQDLRLAISYAVDMPAIVQNVYGADGAAATTNSSVYYNDYDPALNDSLPYDYDLDRAKELLAESGYSEGDLTLRLCYQNEADLPQVATLIQAYLQAIGIKVELNVMEAALFNTSINDPGAFDMYLNCTMSLNTPGRLGLMDMNGYTTGANGIFVTDNTLQDKFNAANLASTYSTETVTDLLNYIEEMDYVYPLFYRYTHYITTDRVTDIVLDRNYAIIPGASTVIDK